jgi:hypothetical protein
MSDEELLRHAVETRLEKAGIFPRSEDKPVTRKEIVWIVLALILGSVLVHLLT